MRILYIHNNYAVDSGEEQAARSLISLLRANGHEVRTLFKTTEGVDIKLSEKISAFFSGIHHRAAARTVDKVLTEFKPDMVQVQNLYPWFSPAILPVIAKRNIPVVMRTPNYRLFCPTGLFFDRSHICEKCATSSMHEFHCVLKNCTGSRSKSMGYALRNAFARVTKKITGNVSMFIVQTEFAKSKFVEYGIPPEKISIVPGYLETLPDSVPSTGDYIAYIGRISPEKGISDFIGAARLLPDIPFVMAGDYSAMPNIKNLLPPNIELTGFLTGKELENTYCNARVVVVPSLWYDSFPNTIIRALAYSKPVIVSNIGTLPYIIDNHLNGCFFESGNYNDLSDNILKLFNDPDLAFQMGANGRHKVEQLYSKEPVYKKLIDIYSSCLIKFVNNTNI